jgi:hypothetical protein
MFLTVDHPNDDGADHRRELGMARDRGQSAGSHFYMWLKREGFPARFRLLCFNCNSGRHRNGGLCPHQRKRLRAVA